MVVAGRVEALALLVKPRGVELRVQDSLLVVERPGEVGAVRAEDCASSSPDHILALELVGEREIRRIGGGALEVRGADDECP